MDGVELRFTVLFEEPFWVGMVERTDEAGYAVARHVFGAEPAAPEIYTFSLRNYAALAFSPAIPGETQAEALNFKRRKREAQRALASTGVSSKAHEAMRLQLEQHKLARQEVSKAQREAEKEQKFLLAQQRKKEKHRGH
jgi:hypothetical protein